MTRDIDRRSILAAGAVSAALAARPALAADPGPVVATTTGRVRGYRDGPISVFKGVPYGASTAGSNRWQPPRKPQAWTGVRESAAYGNRPPQIAIVPNMIEETVSQGREPIGEDCLTLNLWTPRTGPNSGKRPVMVWFHGGGYTTGSGSGIRYAGTNLATKQDVVVVTVTHRLNVFGYLWLGDVAGERYAVGNTGMLDCVAALEWVRDNIAQFGGDPANVTIFGESGGAGKVSTMMAMPSARGLFHRAIAQSGVALRHQTRAAASETAGRFLRQLGIGPGQYDRLQTATMQQVLDAWGGMQPGGNFGPVVEPRSVPTNPFDPAAPAMTADVPFMMGSNQTEITFMRDTPLDPISEAELKQHVVRYTRVSDADADRLIALYRTEHPGRSNTYTYQLIASDWWMTEPVSVQAERKGAQGPAPAYLYHFEKPCVARGGKLVTPHSLEICYAFDNLALSEPLVGPVTPELQALADKVSGLWCSFARSGVPTAKGVPAWPAYKPQDRAVMVLDDQCKVTRDPHRAARLAISELKAKQAGPPARQG